MSHPYKSHESGPLPEFYRLSAQQQVGLEKHQRMVEDALQWQAQSQIAETEPETVPARVLRPVFSALLSLLTR